MISFHINSPTYGKSDLDVAYVSTVPLDILKENVSQTIRAKFPGILEVNLAKSASLNGITYNNGMIVAYGLTGGLTEFAEIIQLCIISDDFFCMVELLCGWYNEHYRAFKLSLSPSREVKLLSLSELN